MLELFQISLAEEEAEEEKEGVKIMRPERAQGSGRKKGTFKITDEIIEEVRKFIDFCGVQAHNRRREDISMLGWMSAGQTWKGSIRLFIRKTFFEGREGDMPSWYTIRRLGLPPNHCNTASKTYRGVIKARPASLQNNQNLGKAHSNAHSCASNVRFAMEFASRFPSKAIVCSVDDK